MDAQSYLLNELNSHHVWEGEQVFKRGEELKSANTIDTKLYFIEYGAVRVYIRDTDGEHTIRLGYSNNLMAALDSFVSEAPSDLVIETLKETKVKYVEKKKYMNFIQSSAQRLEAWTESLTYLIYQQLERERDILTQSPKQRYLRVLKRSPQLFQEIPHKYIASYLRMTPETLSRLKKS